MPSEHTKDVKYVYAFMYGMVYGCMNIDVCVWMFANPSLINGVDYKIESCTLGHTYIRTYIDLCVVRFAMIHEFAPTVFHRLRNPLEKEGGTKRNNKRERAREREKKRGEKKL